ncbi:hypothetical protein G7A66_13165 [Altererythrobacter sp. SALINAS58]|uniref:hypothetical protein n=1 Tax=Alteripontixanthobacter muriae TaxID=2705546 RepID=UPI001575890C|nr:hypothetical protein [Alteripontixanthobacter muriae]NTZ44010.1 hypothetical protein [Alteripontixanthobacter muriae]
MLAAALVLTACCAGSGAATPEAPRAPVAMTSKASVRVVRAEKIEFEKAEPAEQQARRRTVVRDGRRLIEFV